jgi:cytochrome c biogenesis protein CcmG/thiol:disulfide interchange protein DsbE
MNKRWILALTAAVGIALLAVPLFVARTPPAVDVVEVEAPSLSSAAAPSCKAGSASKLDFTLKDPSGADVQLSAYKGKVVLVNFWATWCGPCRVEIPEFVEVYNEFKDRGFVILGVLSQDTPSREQLAAFMAENRMEYPVLYTSEPLEKAFGELVGLPTSFLLGRDGSVCAKQLGPASKEDVKRSVEALL